MATCGFEIQIQFPDSDSRFVQVGGFWGGAGLMVVSVGCSYGTFERRRDAFMVMRLPSCCLQTCLIGDEDSELLCLELLGGLAILSVAIYLPHLQHKT